MKHNFVIPLPRIKQIRFRYFNQIPDDPVTGRVGHYRQPVYRRLIRHCVNNALRFLCRIEWRFSPLRKSGHHCKVHARRLFHIVDPMGAKDVKPHLSITRYPGLAAAVVNFRRDFPVFHPAPGLAGLIFRQPAAVFPAVQHLFGQGCPIISTLILIPGDAVAGLGVLKPHPPGRQISAFQQLQNGGGQAAGNVNVNVRDAGIIGQFLRLRLKLRDDATPAQTGDGKRRRRLALPAILALQDISPPFRQRRAGRNSHPLPAASEAKIPDGHIALRLFFAAGSAPLDILSYRRHSPTSSSKIHNGRKNSFPIRRSSILPVSPLQFGLQYADLLLGFQPRPPLGFRPRDRIISARFRIISARFRIVGAGVRIQ